MHLRARPSTGTHGATVPNARLLMPQSGRYYLGRVIKLGSLTQEKFLFALEQPKSINFHEFGWTITHVRRFPTRGAVEYVYGRLTKFNPRGKVSVLDAKFREELERNEPNLVIATSPFVYIPAYSGIAYLHVWNEIHHTTFVNRLIDIVVETHAGFFVDCRIEAITDLRIFAKRIASLDSIKEISAKVVPPNPLFGHLWGPLRDFLKRRDAGQLNLKETAKPQGHLNTNIQRVIDSVLSGSPPVAEVRTEITDSAVLMAADGYGVAQVHGVQKKTEVIVKTSDNIKSFKFDKDPKPSELYEKAKDLLEQTNTERQMKHGEE
jgi:hypothetical protein